MKITEKNAKFAIVRTAFHGGGAASFHNSLVAAERALKKEILKSCQCGCAAIVPITTAAREEMEKAGYEPFYDEKRKLYDELPSYEAGKHYGTICR